MWFFRPIPGLLSPSQRGASKNMLSRSPRWPTSMHTETRKLLLWFFKLCEFPLRIGARTEHSPQTFVQVFPLGKPLTVLNILLPKSRKEPLRNSSSLGLQRPFFPVCNCHEALTRLHLTAPDCFICLPCKQGAGHAMRADCSCWDLQPGLLCMC